MLQYDQLMRMKEYIPDPALSNNYLTGTPLDLVLSREGGLPKGTIYLVSGPPGVGKSTIVLTAEADMQAGYPNNRFLFFSVEMSPIEMKPMADRFEKTKDLPVLFVPSGNSSVKMSNVLPSVLKRGWDVVGLDSYEALKHVLRTQDKMSSTDADQFIMNLLHQHAEGQNDRGVPTSFFLLQMETKSGTVRGSNTLVHGVTSHMEVKFVNKDDPFSSKYITFPKHRRGLEHTRLYFDLHEDKDVFYDLESYLEELERGQSQFYTQHNRGSLSSKLDELFQSTLNNAK